MLRGGRTAICFWSTFVPKESPGKAAEEALDLAGITVNKNAIPFDPEKPFIASGIRIGTPAVTTRGLTEKDMAKIAAWMDRAIAGHQNPKELAKIRKEVKTLCLKYPIYKERLKA